MEDYKNSVFDADRVVSDAEAVSILTLRERDKDLLGLMSGLDSMSLVFRKTIYFSDAPEIGEKLLNMMLEIRRMMFLKTVSSIVYKLEEQERDLAILCGNIAYSNHNEEQISFKYSLSFLKNKLAEFMGFDLEDKNKIIIMIKEYIESRKGIDTGRIALELINVIKDTAEKASAFIHVPSTAPSLWSDRNKDENPAQFIMRVYSDYIGKGLHKGTIKQLDPNLYMALYRWEFKKNREIPEGFFLPGKQELAQVADNRITDEEFKHAQRVVARRHRQRQKDADRS